MKRTKILEKRFKLLFGLKLCLLTTAGIGTATALLYFFTSSSLGDTYGGAVKIIYDLKIRIFPLIFASFYSLTVLALVTAAIAALSVLFSHRIAGPIYRLEQSLKAMAAGDLTVVTRFRANDQLTALEEELNAMARALNHKVRTCADALDAIEQAEEDLARALEKPGSGHRDLDAALSDLRFGIEELRRSSSGVRLKD